MQADGRAKEKGGRFFPGLHFLRAERLANRTKPAGRPADRYFYGLYRHAMAKAPLRRAAPKNTNKNSVLFARPLPTRFCVFIPSVNSESPRPLRRISPMPCGERNGKSPAGTGFAAYGQRPSCLFLQRPCLPVVFSHRSGEKRVTEKSALFARPLPTRFRGFFARHTKPNARLLLGTQVFSALCPAAGFWA